EARGVRIVEGTPVERPVRAGEPLVTPNGRIHADRVVIAADGALPGLVPEMEGRVRCRRLHMLATAPVEGYAVEPLVCSGWGFECHPLRRDGCITLGGFSALDADASYTEREEANPAVHARLERYLHDELGVQAEVTHRWVGLVGYSSDQRAFAGELPGSD